jgi:macrolide-specific efflux system membrane fusion protein
LLPEMTAQVFFITASARDVLTVPLGAITRLDARPRRMPGERNAVAPESPVPQEDSMRPREISREVMMAARERGITPQPAMATVVEADGTHVQKQILIGVSSRVAAEVLAGLDAGDQVVAGIIQRQLPNQAARPGGPTGGFRPGGF